MSYILEALRKAESERRRGAVPDLHAQQVLQAAAPGTEAAAVRAPVWPWLAAAALAAMAGVAAWAVLGRQDAAPRVVLPAQAPVPVPPAPPPPAATEPVPRSVAMTSAPTPPAQTAPSTPTPPPAATTPQVADMPPTSVRKAPPPKREAVPSVAAKAPTQARQAQPAPLPATAAAPAAVAPVPMPSAQPSPAPMPAPTAVAPKADRPPVAEPALPARVPALAELPGDLRQQVPALAIGGSVYSPQASARMVVVNGQVFQEGSALTPELKLEQIRQKSAVFSIRGTRFEVPL